MDFNIRSYLYSLHEAVSYQASVCSLVHLSVINVRTMYIKFDILLYYLWTFLTCFLKKCSFPFFWRLKLQSAATSTSRDHQRSSERAFTHNHHLRLSFSQNSNHIVGWSLKIFKGKNKEISYFTSEWECVLWPWNSWWCQMGLNQTGKKKGQCFQFFLYQHSFNILSGILD